MSRGCIIDFPFDSGITEEMITAGLDSGIHIGQFTKDYDRRKYIVRLVGDSLPSWCEHQEGEGYVICGWGFSVYGGAVVLLHNTYCWPLSGVTYHERDMLVAKANCGTFSMSTPAPI